MPVIKAAQRHASGSASLWQADQIATIAQAPFPAAPLLAAGDALPILPQLDLWDLWPVQTDDSLIPQVAGGELWVMLAAPRGEDPDHRHGIARMWLFHRTAAGWLDCGPLLPDGFSPGAREWSGATRIDLATGKVTLWLTAAGKRGQAPDFEQQIFQASGQLDLSGDRPMVGGWHSMLQSIVHDGQHYADLAVNQGIAGRIKGNRDPYWFRDPADGQGYLLFTGSKSAAQSQSDYDGVIGIAAARDADGETGFDLLPPLVDADGLSNELERPHMLMRDGLYYLFWSTQSTVFASPDIAGPTGLYGMVAAAITGPYTPLNGSGLVLANPPAAPRQAYAWQVIPAATGGLEVVSFVDYPGVAAGTPLADAGQRRAHFGGTPAPSLHIRLSGATTALVLDVA